MSGGPQGASMNLKKEHHPSLSAPMGLLSLALLAARHLDFFAQCRL
jgi:hypothetical protein